MRALFVVSVAWLLAGAPMSAAPPQPSGTLTEQLVTRADPPATLYYNNRIIVTLRATTVSRTPSARVGAARRLVDQLIERGEAGTVSTRLVQGVAVVAVGRTDVFALLRQDADELAGETVEGLAAESVRRLQQAVDEAIEMRTPVRLLHSAERVGAATILFALVLWVTARLHRVLATRLPTRAEQSLTRIASGNTALVEASRATDLLRKAVTIAVIGLVLLETYYWLTFVLRSVAYTRPWGESLRGFLAERLVTLGLMVIHALPNLFTVVLILLGTRVVVRISNVVFAAAEQERLTLPWLYAETAQPTRRLVAALLWIVGFVVAYPYLPGSDSDAFRGMSVFIGLMISLGSSGVVNQLMSGLTITYSRSFRLGDYVSVGDVEGTVTAIGVLSMKVKTLRGEDVTIPNAVVVSGVTKNYSRYDDTEGVFVPTTITIGYDTPWRQVQALLLLAADRTAGVRKSPAPIARATALQDFYVQYTLFVALEQPGLRGKVLADLHANVLDVFNEFDVQITSPNYEADPDTPKIVPRSQWYAAPAPKPPADGAGRPAAG